MARALTLAATRSLTAPQTSDLWLLLLTIEAEGLETPLRLVNDSASLTSRGNTFNAYPFVVELPAETEEGVPRVVLRVDNIDRVITQALRAVPLPPRVTLEVVRREAPDVVEAGPFVFVVREARYDAAVVEVELAFEDVLNLAFPAGAYSPADYPGLF